MLWYGSRVSMKASIEPGSRTGVVLSCLIVEGWKTLKTTVHENIMPILRSVMSESVGCRKSWYSSLIHAVTMPASSCIEDSSMKHS